MDGSYVRKGRKGFIKMEFNEIIEALKQFENTPEFDNYVSGHVNADRVTKYLGTDDGKKLLQPQLDSYFSKGLETWKTNNLDGLVNAKVKELYPDADPKDTELAAVKAELEKMKAESLRKDLTNKALTIANEKHLPVDLVSFFIGADEKTTTDNMGKFEKAFTDALGVAVKEKLKGNSYVPPDGEVETMDGVTAAFAKLNPNIKIAD